MQQQTEPQNLYIPMLKATPNQLIGYSQYVGTKRRIWQNHLFTGLESEKLADSERKEQKRYSGELTPSARKKLKSACEILFALAKVKKAVSHKSGKEFSFRIALITLTLSAPQSHFSDRDIKKLLLEPFLRHFRTRGLFNYVWKAERQRNGNVHFHILTDAYFDKTDLKNYWNKLQAGQGFIETFYRKHGHRQPNSTDVKAVRSQEGMKSYMLKYMLKNPDKGTQLEISRPVDSKSVGKIWDCSLNLKLKNDTAEPIEDWQFELLEKHTEAGKLKRIDCEHCVVYVPVNGRLWNLAPQFVSRRLRDFLKKVWDEGRKREVSPG